MPGEGAFLWGVFWQISAYRGRDMGDPLPITPRDIREWSEMTGTVLRREECGVLFAMDDAFRAAWATESAEQQARREAERKAGVK